MTITKIHRRRTNVEFVQDLMEFSQHGALAQMFVVEAITKWADKITSIPLEELREKFGSDAMVSADAWQSVARELASKIEENYR